MSSNELSAYLKNLPPQFISFEGTEGVGKTTLMNDFCQVLADLGIGVVRTREPGGSPLAEALRGILLDKSTKINSDTELLLMFTARADHLDKTIMPALADGKWVVCDRFFDSTVAYQGFGRYHGDKTALQKIDLLIKHFVGRVPDVSFWLDLDVKTGMARAGKRSDADRFEQESVDFFGRVYQGFEYQYQQDGKRIRRINAAGTPDEVLARIWQAMIES